MVFALSVLTLWVYCVRINSNIHTFFETVKCISIERWYPMPKRVTVIRESETGRNERFHDNFTGADMTRNQFVKKIQNGNYDNYYVREIGGIPTPVSKPDTSRNNNLG